MRAHPSPYLLETSFRRLLLCLTALALLVSATMTIVRHNPVALLEAEASRHLVISSDHASGGHSHDSDEEQEQVAGHMHGHNPGDHNHDPPLQLTSLKLDGSDLRGLWGATSLTVMDGRRSDRLYRPPDFPSAA